MKNVRIITNVGRISEPSKATFGTLYLALLTDTNQYFLSGYRASFTHNGETIPAQWTYVPASYLNSSNVTHTVSNKILAMTSAINWETGELLKLGGLEVGIVSNGAALAALTHDYATIATCPANYSRKGEGVTDDQIEILLGIDTLPVAGENSGVIVATTGGVVYPELQSDPVGAVRSAFTSPMEYAKANPISAAGILVGVIEVGHIAKINKFSVLNALTGKKAKGKFVIG